MSTNKQFTQRPRLNPDPLHLQALFGDGAAGLATGKIGREGTTAQVNASSRSGLEARNVVDR
ncbi:hypothetical protein [Streptomyces inhibens]|uniref:hypothetical protein n=1 Tax=Streptomyces inhibens TaxID=2293571 RepID=UPI001EE75A3C|nr:hypothetical protein [Streptomyces inhibens]UKY48020.1 hypothetical protein KI385_03805 [Streptomyces inhibens]